MNTRRQKNIADTSSALRRALDRREELLAQLVRNEARIAKLIKRNNRAHKANAQADCSVAAGEAPSPFTGTHEVTDELNDAVPDLSC